jgi:hypothetical protein
MAKQFKYYDDWRGAPLTCSCGWSGPLDDKQTDMYEQLLDFECPKCSATLAVISFPTKEDIELAVSQGSEDAKKHLDSIRKAQDLEYERARNKKNQGSE